MRREGKGKEGIKEKERRGKERRTSVELRKKKHTKVVVQEEISLAECLIKLRFWEVFNQQ